MKKLLLILLVVLVAGSFVLADGEAKAKKKSWFEKTKFNGDLRLRYEGFDQDGKFDDGRRDRFRYRFRWGFSVKVHDKIKIGAQLRSGDPLDPVSDNQTIGGGFTKKEINIAEAYADFSLSDDFSLIAGKFSPKKLWTVSDMHYDDDVVAEGAMARWNMVGGDGLLKSLKAVGYLYALEESKSGKDSYSWGAQFGPTLRLGQTSQLQLGVGYDTYIEPQALVDMTLDKEIKGNKVSNFLDEEGQLISDFDILSLFGIWKSKASKQWPIKVTVFVYRNSGARGMGADHDAAYFARLQVGDYKKPGQMAFRMSIYHSDPDALFYVYTQSDTTRGSNLDGYRLDYRLGLHSKGYLNFTWYNTDVAYGEAATMNRWQVDYILKF